MRTNYIEALRRAFGIAADACRHAAEQGWIPIIDSVVGGPWSDGSIEADVLGACALKREFANLGERTPKDVCFHVDRLLWGEYMLGEGAEAELIDADVAKVFDDLFDGVALGYLALSKDEAARVWTLAAAKFESLAASRSPFSQS